MLMSCWFRSLPALFGITALSFINSTEAYTQWSGDSTSNTPICVQPNDQEAPAVVSDGAGGGIIAWMDKRTGVSQSVIYAQRFSADGSTRWVTGGIPICIGSTNQTFPVVVSDGVGGAIVAWIDKRSDAGDIYAQRIDSVGNLLWGVNGTPICTASGPQLDPVIISDDAGGAIIVWKDGRSDGGDIYAQRVDASGVVQWATNGIAACIASNIQYEPTVTTDGVHGAIVAWTDERTGDADVYAQRVDASGLPQWGSNGVGVVVLPEQHNLPSIVSDGVGGAILAWDDWRSTDQQIYMQRLNAMGNVRWITNGIFVSDVVGNQLDITIVSDGNGGAVVAHQDGRGNGIDIYAERFDSTGSSVWDTAGVLLADIEPYQTGLALTGDGEGGFIVSWADVRNVAGWDIYAQRVDSSGTALWRTDGVPVTTAPSFQSSHRMLPDGGGGAFVVWQDIRDGVDQDIYAERVLASGSLTTESSVAVNGGWNLLSAPRHSTDMSALALFPGATASAYAFNGTSYQNTDTLTIGGGYWVKFGGPGLNSIAGATFDSISVVVGSANRWVLIGSVSFRVPLSALTSNPPGALLQNSIKGFNGSGYFTPAAIEPGQAYWVFVTQPCTLTINRN